MARLIAALLVAIALVVPACGGDDGGANAAAARVEASYYVYFARRSDALEATKELRKEGFRTEMREDTGVEWLVIASREVQRGDLEGTEGQMRYIAYQFQGDYDGVDVEGDD